MKDQATLLVTAKAPAGFIPGGRHSMEFRATGDTLTLLMDEVTVASVRDTNFQQGRTHFIASPGSSRAQRQVPSAVP